MQHSINDNTIKTVIAIGEEQLSVLEIMKRLFLKHRPTFLENYLTPAIAAGYVRMLYPDSPRHPRQKYLLTAKGLLLYKELVKH